MAIEKDTWLGEIFGYDVYKATLVDGRPGDLCEELAPILDNEAHGHSVFLFARVTTERVDQLRALNELGFQVVDVNVTFERRASPSSPLEAATTVEMCSVEPRHHDDVLRIAASCFQYSRFHLDPSVSDCIANEIKRAWVRSYLHGLRGEALWIALLDGRPIGFVAMLAQESEGMRSMLIDLIGVDKNHHGKGVGRQMVAYVIDAHAQECDRLVVGTQVANIRSMRLYERSGFRVASSSYMLHLHKTNGGKSR